MKVQLPTIVQVRDALKATVTDLSYIDLSWDSDESALPGCDINAVATKLWENLIKELTR